MRPTLPRRTPGASERQHTLPEPPEGPSPPLRTRAESGWEKFLRRVHREEPER